MAGVSGGKGLSVLLPVAAATPPEHLDAACRSVVEQTRPPEEVVLVTNEPLPDPLSSVVDSYAGRETPTVHHVAEPSAGCLGGVLQAGLERCVGPFVARMDADDVAVETRFERQCARMGDADVVGGQLAEFHDDPDDPRQVRRVPLTHGAIADRMPWRCPMNHQTALFRREDALAVGGYRDVPYMEDWDLWARCLAGGLRFENLDSVLVRARVGPETYRRRGGVDYARAELAMQRRLRRYGLVSGTDALRNLLVRVPPRLVPNPFRRAIYRAFVRRDHGNSP